MIIGRKPIFKISKCIISLFNYFIFSNMGCKHTVSVNDKHQQCDGKISLLQICHPKLTLFITTKHIILIVWILIIVWILFYLDAVIGILPHWHDVIQVNPHISDWFILVESLGRSHNLYTIFTIYPVSWNLSWQELTKELTL